MDREARADGREDPRPRPHRRHRRRPDRHVDGHEGDDAEREVDLAGERDREEGDGGQRSPEMGGTTVGSPGALVGEEREREEHGDPAEEMRPALGEPVRREREGETSHGRGGGREIELP